MNKKMYFALAATVGLFASCSSDSLTENQAARMAGIDDNASAKIEIGLTPGYEVTRGTGVVGNVGGAADAQWAGQKFNVLMLEKGTALGARIDPADAATSVIKGAPFSATGSAVVALDNDAVYYPTLNQGGQTGVYDFWGYRLDGSEVLDASSNVQFNGYDDPAATAVKVPFAIDGTQDVMIAETTPSDAAYAAANPTAIYSAKSARNGVKPTMAFKHLLTSLTFKVKAKSVDITQKATNPTSDPLWQPGYQITNIQVKSKATGELVVAYTPGNEVADADRIEWAAGQDWANPTTLTTFELQCRKKDVHDAAHITMIQINKNINTDLAYGGALQDLAGNTKFTWTNATDRDALAVYDSEGTDPTTGLPTGNLTTLGAITGTYGYILTYDPADNRGAGLYESTPNAWECDFYATASVTNDLVPFATNNVTPVVLDWDVVTPATYAWEQTTNPSETATASVSVATTEAIADAIATYAAATPAAAGNKGTVVRFYTEDANPGYDGTEAIVGYAISKQTAAAVLGDPIVSNVGEPMLVAPSNDAANSGYEVIVSYKYWKKTSASTAALTNGQTQPIKVNNYTIVGGVKEPGAFVAGTNYNVTITLYSDGEVLNGDATSEPWADGGDLDAGDDN